MLFLDTTYLLQLNFGRFQRFIKDTFDGRPFASFEIHNRSGALYVNFSFLNKILELPETSVIPSSVKRGKSD